MVCPGPVRTAMLEDIFTPMARVLKTDLDSVFQQVSKNVPLRRIAAPPEISGVCVFLAGDDSSFMTGSTLVIDGGIHLVDCFAMTVGEVGLSFG